MYWNINWGIHWTKLVTNRQEVTKVKSISVEHAVEVLNDALRCDQEVVQKLIETRLPCNEKLAEHPTIQVSGIEGTAKVGLLGIINGVFGICNDGKGYIIAIYDESERLIGFKKSDLELECI